MSLEAWFSTPLFVYNFEGARLDAIQQEVTTAMPGILATKNDSPWGDNVKTTFVHDGCNDVETFNLHTLKKELFWAVTEYANAIQYPNPDFKLIESWVNFLNNGEFQYDHTHPNCRVSGVYYYDTNGEDGEIRFTNPNPIMQFNGFPSDRMPRSSITYKPKVGRMILFPSWLTHRVNINNTTNQRVSITFNFL